MRKHLHNLFIPHHGNNHKAKILHHNNLSKLVLILLFFQVFITVLARIKPGVLGYASNISVDQVLSLTNANRQSGGLSALSFNPTLAESAKEKAQDMFAKNYWAHNAPDGTTPWYFFKNVGYNYLYAGENLARDFGDSDNVVKAWMESPTHRDNIMSGRYTEIGIAVVNGILNGQETTLVVQHFGKPSVVAAAIPAQAAQAEARKPSATTIVQNSPIPLVAVAQPELQSVEMIDVSPVPSPLNVEYTLSQEPENIIATPTISPLDLTKSLNIAMSGLVIAVLALDGWLIYSRKTVRRSGKNFVHLSLFALVIIIIVLTKSGKII